MRKVSIVLVLIVVASCAMLAACGGGSEADKAYDNWAKNTLPKMTEADTQYNAKAPEIAQDDVAGARAIMDEYISVLKPGIEELAAIDVNALTGNRKDEASSSLPILQAKLEQCEQALAMYDEMLG